MAVHVIYSTFATRKDAQKCVESLLSSKLIACSTISSAVESHYMWKGKRVVAKEFFTFMKTSVPAKAKKALLAMHPYETPCILSWKVDSNKSFENWIKASSK